MNELMYLFQLMLYQLLFWGLYAGFLKTSGLHKFNRGFLLCGFCFSFLLPLLSWEGPATFFNNHTFDTSDIPDTLYLAAEDISSFGPLPDTELPFWLNLGWLILIISFVLLTRLIVRVSLLVFQGISGTFSVRGLKVVNTSELSAFSFFHYVFLPFSFLEEDVDGHPILLHEEAHCKYFHSADRLLLDIMGALFWFNPIIRLYKSSLIEIHEYQADRYVLATGFSKFSYQDLIYNLATEPTKAMVSHFKDHLIKKRINMMNKHFNNLAFFKSFWVSIVALTLIVVMSFRPTTEFTVTSYTGPELPFGLEIPIFDHFGGERPSMFPVNADLKHRVSSGFGMRRSPFHNGEKRFHQGMDIAIEKGSELYATADGIVVEAKE
ncbi:MAG: M56 family metallopeptidase, partial [Bacteroidota bacterium]